jgi:hypothetical protein
VQEAAAAAKQRPVHVRPADRGVAVERGRRRCSTKCALVAHRGPQSPDPGAALPRGENLHSRIVGVQHRAGADVPTNRLNQRVEQCSHAAHPVAQGGAVEIDPLSRVDRILALPIERGRPGPGLLAHVAVAKYEAVYLAVDCRFLCPR